MPLISASFFAFSLFGAALHALLPARAKPWLLLSLSLFFYACAGWRCLLFLAVLTCLTWGGALLIEGTGKSSSRLLRTAIVTLGAGYLVLLKYGGLLPGMGLSLFQPLGASYLTFQAMGYVMDVQRGRQKAEKNIGRVALFLCFFPQVTQGPISGYGALSRELFSPKPFEEKRFFAGLLLAVFGLFKKLVIAERLFPVVAAMLKHVDDLSGLFLFLAMALYALALYCDFSGGIDLVRGVALAYGISLPENFRQPFFAVSLADYWRRWHITLTAWFRTYVFYPVALAKPLQRLGKVLPSAIATVLVFVLIGLWHTASLNSLFFGLYFGILCASSLLLTPVWRRLTGLLHISAKAWYWRLFCILRTLFLVCLGQFFACTADAGLSLHMLCRAFMHPFSDFSATVFRQYIRPEPLECLIIAVSLALLFVLDVLAEHCQRKRKGADGLWLSLAARPFPLRLLVLTLFVLAVMVFGHYGYGYDGTAFLYGQF